MMLKRTPMARRWERRQQEARTRPRWVTTFSRAVGRAVWKKAIALSFSRCFRRCEFTPMLIEIPEMKNSIGTHLCATRHTRHTARHDTHTSVS